MTQTPDRDIRHNTRMARKKDVVDEKIAAAQAERGIVERAGFYGRRTRACTRPCCSTSLPACLPTPRPLPLPLDACTPLPPPPITACRSTSVIGADRHVQPCNFT